VSSSGAVVFVVDDDPSMRRALSRLLKVSGRDVETFATPADFLARPAHVGAGCVVLDLKLPGLSGLEVQEALVSSARDLPIVFISGHGRVPAAVRAMKAGAIDFLTKPFQDADLLASVEKAIERSVSSLADRSDRQAIDTRLRLLTPREREVLPLVAEGLPNKKIAARLGTSLQTIKVHRARVMEKMEATSLADLVRMAGRGGIAS
jgi:RNA polymerase sigma factor (sigma-70 family)